MPSTSGARVAAYWTGQHRALVEGLAGVAEGRLESVHPTRVATRRLRSTLRTFGDLFDDTAVAGLDRRLRRLAAELGAVRDREVLRELLGAWEGVDDATRGAVTARLDNEIAGGLRSLSELAGRVTVPEHVAEVPPPSGDAGRLFDKASRQVTKRFGRADTPQPDAARMHAVRKAVKRARYAAEVFADGSGGEFEAAREVFRLEQLQDVLGRHQDLVLAADYLRAAAADSRSLDTPEVARWVADLEVAVADAAQEAFTVAATTGTYPATTGLGESA